MCCCTLIDADLIGLLPHPFPSKVVCVFCGQCCPAVYVYVRVASGPGPPTLYIAQAQVRSFCDTMRSLHGLLYHALIAARSEPTLPCTSVKPMVFVEPVPAKKRNRGRNFRLGRLHSRSCLPSPVGSAAGPPSRYFCTWLASPAHSCTLRPRGAKFSASGHGMAKSDVGCSLLL